MQASKLLERLTASRSKLQLLEVLKAAGAEMSLFPPGMPLCVRYAYFDSIKSGGTWLGSFACDESKCASGGGHEVVRRAVWHVAWPPLAVWRIAYAGGEYVTFDLAEEADCGAFDWEAMRWSGCEWMRGESDVLLYIFGSPMRVLPPYPLIGRAERDDFFGAYVFITDEPKYPVAGIPPTGRKPRFAIYLTVYEEDDDDDGETVYLLPVPLPPDKEFEEVKDAIHKAFTSPPCDGASGILTRAYGRPDMSKRAPARGPEDERHGEDGEYDEYADEYGKHEVEDFEEEE